MRVRTHTNPFNYFMRMPKADFPAIFPTYSGEMDFEVGFGRGIFIRQYAATNPNRHIVGVEVRKQMVTLLQERITALCMPNVHLIHGNAQICLEDVIPDACIGHLFIFHPDPWFKKRHHNRRVINPAFLDLISQKLKPAGKLYLSTDVTELWEYMDETVRQHPHFIPTTDDAFWEETYQTHWHAFSEKDQRPNHYGVYTRAHSRSN